jgi:predicted transposase YbfD/YdcC
MERTILSVLEETPDYRQGNGIRHKLAEILMIGLLTFICNGNDYAAMYVFGKTHEVILKSFLELSNGIPSQDTFERVFQNVNPKYLAVTFKKWVDDIKEAACQHGGSRLLCSIDGKAIRGSKRAGKKAVHVVTAFASQLRLVLGEVSVNKKSNEITAIPELLEMFCQKGMVITIDAMGTQKSIASAIIHKEADYVLAVKRNQETLYSDIERILEEEAASKDIDELRENGQYEVTIETGHGRVEIRECHISTAINGLSRREDWAGVAGFGVIFSIREVVGKEPTYSYDYFIFSLLNTNAAEMMRIKRSHWAIENNLHWMLDVTFREDACRASLGNSAENLNILRKEALHLMKQEDSFKASMKSKRLRCGWDLPYAFKVIGVN